MIKRPQEEFRLKNRIQITRIPTTNTYQASTDTPYRTSERDTTALRAMQKLANRLELEGREVLWYGAKNS